MESEGATSPVVQDKKATPGPVIDDNYNEYTKVGQLTDSIRRSMIGFRNAECSFWLESSVYFHLSSSLYRLPDIYLFCSHQ